MARSRSSKKSKSNHYLPEELIIKILTWTKATSLLRFKSVCKLWRSIITDKKFIESHHTNSLKNPSILMITYEGKKRSYDVDRFMASIVYSNSPKDSVDLRLPSPFDRMEFVSSCNGIVCVRNAISDDIYLLNPLTRMSKRLPRLNKYKRQALQNFEFEEPEKVDVAFGYDCVSCDFKVLKFTYYIINGGYPFSPKHISISKMQLYSSNANSWRLIKDNIFLRESTWSPFKPVFTSGPVVDGKLYLEGKYEIVTFDLHNEIFGRIRLPSLMLGPLAPNRCSHVFDFEGSVAMVFGSVNRSSLSLKMQVVSGEVLLNKLTFEDSSKIVWVYLHSGSMQFVGKTESGEILWYDYTKKETKYLKLPSQNIARVVKHTESLLPIKGFDEYIS